LALLDLFIPPEIYITIAENTNLYTTTHNAPIVATPTNQRYWWPTNENEIRVLFGILFYIGVHKEPNYKIYWETPKLNGPIHAIPKHMSLNRYENLHRYLHVSPPKHLDSQIETQQPLEPLQASLEAQKVQASLEAQEAQAGLEAQEAQAGLEAQEAQASPEAQEAQAGPEAQEAQAGPEAQEAQASLEAQEAQASPEAQEAQAGSEAQKAQASLETQEAQASLEAQEAQASPEAQEAQASLEA
jgi:hypothetical protein